MTGSQEMSMRALAAVLLAFATAGAADAQCPANPNGGPTYVTLRTGADGAGTDFDLGRNATTHGLEVPALDLAACLGDCDASTDPDCAITSLRLAPAVRGIAPPMPLLIGGIPLCAALRPPSTFTATGSANVQTGALDLSTTLQMRLFFTTMNAICPTCVAGTCSGGANDGSPCQTQRTISVSSTTYDLSIACQPAEGGFLGSVSVPVSLMTGTASQGTCPGQAAGDACSATPAAGTCNQTTCTSGDGIVQDCCSGDTSRSCFPAAGVTRQGQANAPAPAWPSTTYPKQAAETVANATCVAAISNTTVDQALGLPGPAAAEMDVTTEWVQIDTGTTTTTLSGGTTTTLGGGSTTTTTVPGNCAPPCNDDDVCTTDTCTDVTCTYPLASPGIGGARCLAQRMRERPLCGTATVDAKLDRTIDKALGMADTLLGKADGATGRKRTRALKKARAQLTRIEKKTDKAAARGKIDGVCVLTILGETSRIRAAFADVS